jgi:tetratricopeptide (TPR) repeat protein
LSGARTPAQDASDDVLVQLISREQRGLRRTLIFGIVVLFLMLVMSIGLAFVVRTYSLSVTKNLATLETQAFQTRRDVDTQFNRVSDLEAQMRRMYTEIRGTMRSETLDMTPEAGIIAAQNYLQRGASTISEQRQIELLAQTGDPLAPETALFRGIAALQSWERSGNTIPAGDTALPETLQRAQRAFAEISTDPELGRLARLGMISVDFTLASSPRGGFSKDACEPVIDALTALEQQTALGLQPLYWRAQCERKLGRISESLRDYGRALNMSRYLEATDPRPNDRTETTLKMNAYHGLGTVLIASLGHTDNGNVAAAQALARDVCEPDKFPTQLEQTRLAFACLQEAMRIRREDLRQTPNQISGSGENITFIHLRDGELNKAYQHTVATHRTGLFAWNESLRALTAERLAEAAGDRQARRTYRDALAEALGNVRRFEDGQFNLCELRVLLSDEDYDDLERIVLSQRPNVPVECPDI